MPRACSICTSRQRKRIDAALLSGAPKRRIAAQYRISEQALRRHRAHVGATIKRAARRQGEMLEDTLLGELQRIRAELWRLLSDTKGNGDSRASVAVLRELRETIGAVDAAISRTKPAGEAERERMTPEERHAAIADSLLAFGFSAPLVRQIRAELDAWRFPELQPATPPPRDPVTVRAALPPPADDPEAEPPPEFVHESGQPLRPTAPTPRPAPAPNRFNSRSASDRALDEVFGPPPGRW